MGTKDLAKKAEELKAAIQSFCDDVEVEYGKRADVEIDVRKQIITRQDASSSKVESFVGYRSIRINIIRNNDLSL